MSEADEMPDKATKRPLVTFALFAYNQEQYVREAVKGAFAQTYEPLEIILSDDCSQDGTFDIMVEMAAEYSGPHRVRAEKTSRNLGVINHVFLRGRQAQGEIVVLAAGDDVSRPERCERHVAAYSDPTVFGVTTGYDLIDDRGRVVETDISEPVIKTSLHEQIRLFRHLEAPYVVIQGSTSSYRRKLFDMELPEARLTFAEDNLMNFVIYAHGHRVALIEESLVDYRTHSAALTNRKVFHKDASSEERAVMSWARDQQSKFRTFIDISGKMEDQVRVNFDELRRQRDRATLINDWSESRFLSRLNLTVKSVLARDFTAARWRLARIAGRFPYYQPRTALKTLGGRLRRRP